MCLALLRERSLKPWFSFDLSKDDTGNHHHTTNDVELVNLRVALSAPGSDLCLQASDP